MDEEQVTWACWMGDWLIKWLTKCYHSSFLSASCSMWNCNARRSSCCACQQELLGIGRSAAGAPVHPAHAPHPQGGVQTQQQLPANRFVMCFICCFWTLSYHLMSLLDGWLCGLVSAEQLWPRVLVLVITFVFTALISILKSCSSSGDVASKTMSSAYLPILSTNPEHCAWC